MYSIVRYKDESLNAYNDSHARRVFTLRVITVPECNVILTVLDFAIDPI